jgi:ABC-type antimicrobial peptide transport system permease subunit
MVQEERKNADAYDKSIKEASDKWEAEHKDDTDEKGNKLTNPYEEYTEIRHNRRKEAWIIDSAREKLVEEGKCKTFIVEGIVSEDPNNGILTPALIAPLDKFFEITGRSKSDYNGIKFHVSNIFSRDFQKKDFENAINEKQNVYYSGMEDSGPDYYSYTSPYLQGILTVVEGVKYIIGVVLILFVLISISILNTLNVTISGLQMRRNEFAQLRSLGMTKRSLLKAVLLEGGIVWIIATIIGIVLGIGIEYVTYITLMRLIINSSMYIFWPGIIITAILSLLVLAGSNYIFFNQMKLDIAEELLRSGD